MQGQPPVHRGELPAEPRHRRRGPIRVAAELGATPAQIALAWLLAQGDDIGTIPGTRRVNRVEENTAGDGLQLTAAQLARLNALTPAAGERHSNANMATIDQ